MQTKKKTELKINNLGLYDLKIVADSGAIEVDERNRTFEDAIAIIQNHMYCKGGRDD